MSFRLALSGIFPSGQTIVFNGGVILHGLDNALFLREAQILDAKKGWQLNSITWDFPEVYRAVFEKYHTLECCVGPGRVETGKVRHDILRKMMQGITGQLRIRLKD